MDLYYQNRYVLAFKEMLFKQRKRNEQEAKQKIYDQNRIS